MSKKAFVVTATNGGTTIKCKNGIEINIIPGDIATVKAGAYVVPQYPDKMATHGVAARFMDSDYYAAVSAYRKKLPIKLGQVVPVETGVDGGADLLIHAAVLGMDRKKHTYQEAYEYVQDAVTAALDCAEEYGINHIAFPPLATGKYGRLTYVASARAMISAILAYNRHSVKEITICILPSKNAYKLFSGGGAGYVNRSLDSRKR